MDIRTISVIITVFNLEECLSETLESLSNQIVKPYEVIIVNDGSQDASQQIIDNFVADNLHWKCFYTENKGVAHARNLGFLASSGEYIMFLDGDDLFREDLISKFSAATLHNSDIVICRSREYDHVTRRSHDLSWAIRAAFLPKEKKFSVPSLNGTVCYTFMGWAWDKLFKRDLLEKFDLSFPDLKNSEDLVFVYSAVMLAENIEVVDAQLVQHRVSRSNSLSNSLEQNPSDFVVAILLLEQKIRSYPEVWRRERSCFVQWALDFYLWGERNSWKKSTSSSQLDKSFKVLDRFKKIYLSAPNSIEYYPFLKLRLLVRSLPFFSNCLSSLLYYLAAWKKFGTQRMLFCLFSKIIKKSRIFL